MRITLELKSIFFSFILILCLQNVWGQNKQSDWLTYSIPGVVSFKVPPTMEVRSEESFQAHAIKSFHQSPIFELICDECDLFFEEANLVLQPIGLNSNPYSEEFRTANKSYGRIIFSFSYSDFLSQDDLKDLTPLELTVLDTIWRNGVRDGLNCMKDLGTLFDVKDGSFKWYPLKKKQFSGLWTLVTEYNRPGTGAETHVKEYKFFYEGKLLMITMAYNKKYETKYKDDFNTFIHSLKIETNNNPKRQRHTDNGLFYSDEYHVRFSYDPNIFEETKKSNKTSHCFCKLESSNGLTILFSAWDSEFPTDDVSIHDEEIVEYMKQTDLASNEYYDKIITSCKKDKIGNIDVLVSVMTTVVPEINVEYVCTEYRAFYKNRYYTFDFYTPKSEYNKNKNYAKELMKGLQFK